MFLNPLGIIPIARRNAAIAMGIVRLSVRMTPERGGMVRKPVGEARRRIGTVTECIRMFQTQRRTFRRPAGMSARCFRMSAVREGMVCAECTEHCNHSPVSYLTFPKTTIRKSTQPRPKRVRKSPSIESQSLSVSTSGL